MVKRVSATAIAFTKNIQQIITNTVTNCGVQVGASAGIDITGDGNKVENADLSQSVQFNMQCFSEMKNRNQMASDISNALIAKIDQTNKGILAQLAGGRTKSMVAIKNEVQSVFESNDTMNCITDIVANNTIKITGSNNELKQVKSAQAISGISDCIMSRLQEMETVATAINSADTEVISKSSGLEIPNPFESIGTAITGIAVVGLLFVLGIVYLIAKLIGSIF